eukprot:g13148.t1
MRSRIALHAVAIVAAASLCCSGSRCSVSAFAFTAPLRSASASARGGASSTSSWGRRVQRRRHLSIRHHLAGARALHTRSKERRAPHAPDAGGRRLLSMAQETLILTEENVVSVLAEAKKELGTLFGNNAENTAVGITGDCEFVCLDGPSVVVRLTGRFWHEKSTVLARVGSFVQSRIPECVDVEIEDPTQLEDADPQGPGQAAEIVSVSGDWCAWSAPGTPLSADKDGRAFSGTVLLPRGKHRFRFVVDGEWCHNPQLLTERDEATGELRNIVTVSANSKLRLQLPEKLPAESPDSAEDTDYMNSLKEYGLRTPTPPKSSYKHFGEDDDDDDDGGGGGGDTAAATDSAAPRGDATMTAAGTSSSVGGATFGGATSCGAGGKTAAVKPPLPAPPPSATTSSDPDQQHSRVVGSGNSASTAASAVTGSSGGNAEGGPVQGVGGLGLGGSGPEGDEDASSDHRAAEAAARARAMSRRRKEAEASSLAAVGACLVTSSVRKDGKLIVAMVGLPGRGKSFIARSIVRHLDWIGLKSRIFSVKDRRRQEVAMYEPAEYFEAGMHARMHPMFPRACLLWTDAVPSFRIYNVVFIESICNDEVLVQRNIVAIQQSSPEYKEKSAREVEREVRSRIGLYRRIYEPLNAEEGHSFIKLIDAGRQMATNLISGYIPGRITLLCLNLHLKPRPIWMSRHGESEFNMQGRIGGDAPLTAAGKVYAGKLTEFMKRRYPPRRHQGQSSSAQAGGVGSDGDRDVEDADDGEELVVWTSTMLRTGQTVAPMASHREVMKWSQLTEINAGLMDSLTYEYVAENMPVEYEARQKDKLRYRYPGGESYQDLFLRLEPVIFEMLRERSPLLVVGHQAILRVLYGYLTGKEPGECPTIHMPLHTAIKLTPRAYTCEEEWFRPLEECGVEDDKCSPHKMA